MARLVLRNVTVIDSTGAPPKLGVDVVIDGDRFEATRPTGSQHQDADVVDGTGKFLMPGLWESHTHLRGVLGDDAEASQSGLDATMRLFASRGITTVVDLGGPIQPFAGYRERLRSEGPKGRAQVLFAGPPFTGIEGWPFPLHRNASLVNQVGSGEEARECLGAQLDRGPDVVKIIYDGEPGSPDKLPAEALPVIIGGAHNRGFRVLVHVRIAQDCIDALRAGADGIEHSFLPTPGREREEVEQVTELLLEKRAYLTPTLTIWEQLGRAGQTSFLDELLSAGCVSEAEVESFQQRVPDWGQAEFPHHPKPECQERLAAALLMLPEMHAAGVKLATGSDIATILPRPAAALRDLALLARAGIPPADVIAAATRNSAEKVGLGSDVGTIESGKLADAILLDANPLEDLGVLIRPGHLAGVIRGGELTPL